MCVYVWMLGKDVFCLYLVVCGALLGSWCMSGRPSSAGGEKFERLLIQVAALRLSPCVLSVNAPLTAFPSTSCLQLTARKKYFGLLVC